MLKSFGVIEECFDIILVFCLLEFFVVKVFVEIFVFLFVFFLVERWRELRGVLIEEFGSIGYL